MDRNDLRCRNLELLRSALQLRRVVTKPQAAEATGLSVVTVNTLMQELLERGEVQLTAGGISSGGRPAQQYAFCADYRLALAVHLQETDGRDTMFISVVDLLGNRLKEQRLQPQKISMEFFIQAVKPWFQQYPQLAVLVVGIPGVEKDGRLLVDYPTLQGTRFAGKLQQVLGCPVYLENDINAAVLGYSAALGGQARQETVVGIYLPQQYPPGAGIVLRGELYKGRDGMAGEVGRLPAFAVGASLDGDASRMASLSALFAATWNPHRLVLYNEAAASGALAQVRELAAQQLADGCLPELELKTSIYEDYGRGICALAMQYLQAAGKERC